MSQEKPKIFLSYAHEDIGMAKRLYQDLTRYGLDIWFDTESLLPGEIWKDKIAEAIENCTHFLALLSSKSLTKKGYVQKELKTALSEIDLYPDDKIFIIPIRLEVCDVSNRKLKRHHWINIFPEKEYKSGLKKILQVVSPGTFLLRSEPMELSEKDVQEMIKRHNFYDDRRNILSKGFFHKYRQLDINGDRIVFDEVSCLMWQ